MKKLYSILGLIVLFISCQKDNTGPETEDLVPSSVVLVFPFNHSECNEGTNVTDSVSTVLFEWMPGQHADEYLLVITDLAVGEAINRSTTETKMPVMLKRGTPYSWYVMSVSYEPPDTALSEVWKFYNAGEGIEFYAPFPAEIISPGFAEKVENTSGYITLVWTGSDIDNDIAGYDVYFGTTESPELIEIGLQENRQENVPVAPATVYYWKVITHDEQGNTSDSGLYQFRVI